METMIHMGLRAISVSVLKVVVSAAAIGACRILVGGWTMMFKWGHPVATLPVTNGTIIHIHRITKVLRITTHTVMCEHPYGVSSQGREKEGVQESTTKQQMYIDRQDFCGYNVHPYPMIPRAIFQYIILQDNVYQRKTEKEAKDSGKTERDHKLGQAVENGLRMRIRYV
eukprot:6179173-Pleurochrysis_carterae.AAC.2